MKLNKIATAVIIGCTILALSACSAKHRYANGSGSGNGYGQPTVSDADTNGAEASGTGENDNFGGTGGRMSARDLLHKRTYYFDFDRSDVHEDDKAAICANANYLVSHPNQHVRIEGHTDPRGSREYNVALAERRANAVANILRARGVKSCQIQIVSYGAERLASPGHTEQDYQLDRRAIIVYQ